MTGISHNIPQVQKQSLSQIIKPLFLKTVLQCKQCMACEAEGGIMETNGLKIFPSLFLLLVCEQMGHPAQQQQNISLLDNLVPLKSVKAHMVVACPCIQLDLLHIRRLQQMEGFVLA